MAELHFFCQSVIGGHNKLRCCEMTDDRNDDRKDDGNESSVQLDDLEVAKLTTINGETYECTHGLPSLQARCTGIDMEKSETAVVLHLQDVAVS